MRNLTNPCVEDRIFTPLMGAGKAVIISTSFGAPRIVCVGNDAGLLHTRRLLLENSGYAVRVCSAADRKLQILADFDGVVICHTVEGEQLDQVLLQV